MLTGMSVVSIVIVSYIIFGDIHEGGHARRALPAAAMSSVASRAGCTALCRTPVIPPPIVP